MQLLLDHLGATIIAGTVLLMVVTLQLRAQQTALEEAVFYRGKARTMTFAETISKEFPKIGEGLSGGGALVEHTVADGQTKEFVYATGAGGSGAGTTEVRYSLVQDTTVRIGRQARVSEDVPIYRLARTEDSGTARTVMSNIRHWRVKILDANGAPTSVLDEARHLKVRLQCLFTFSEGQSREVHQTLWGTTFQPTGLRL
jgi:hypothetical protein